MLTETELFDRHAQSLGEAHRACQELGRNADPNHLAPRGREYAALKKALSDLEGSCRQLAYFRDDARWLKLGIFYAKITRQTQHKFVGQRWAFFNSLMEVFQLGHRRLDELRTNKTGVRGPVLPQRASEWLIMPDHKIPRAYPGRLN